MDKPQQSLAKTASMPSTLDILLIILATPATILAISHDTLAAAKLLRDHVHKRSRGERAQEISQLQHPYLRTLQTLSRCSAAELICLLTPKILTPIHWLLTLVYFKQHPSQRCIGGLCQSNPPTWVVASLSPLITPLVRLPNLFLGIVLGCSFLSFYSVIALLAPMASVRRPILITYFLTLAVWARMVFLHKPSLPSSIEVLLPFTVSVGQSLGVLWCRAFDARFRIHNNGEFAGSRRRLRNVLELE